MCPDASLHHFTQSVALMVTCVRRWLRPTCDVVGMWGGFTEEGIKTIVPAVGRAKVACRLVPDQAPEASPAPRDFAQTVMLCLEK